MQPGTRQQSYLSSQSQFMIIIDFNSFGCIIVPQLAQILLDFQVPLSKQGPNCLIQYYQYIIHRSLAFRFYSPKQQQMSLNQLPRYKDKSESHFRVHFYLKNVYYNGQVRLPVFLQDISTRITKIVEVSILQIYGSVRKIVDLSVGLRSDQLALGFMQTRKKLLLPGENGKLVEHQPVFSQSFKSYCRQLESNIAPVGPIVASMVTMEKRENKHEETAEPLKKIEQESILKKYEVQNQRYSTLCAFGIPLQFKDREILAVLYQKNIKSKYHEWRYKQDMQYLQLEITQTLSQKQISSLDIKLDKHPLLIMPKVHQQFINAIIMKLQLQLNFEKEIDEAELMRKADQIGGVISMVKDEFYGPRKYNLTFNTFGNLTRFQEMMESTYKGCKVGKPRYIIRVCRLQRSFTFCQMMENLALYDLEIRKVRTETAE